MKIDLFKTNGSSPPSISHSQPTLAPQNDEVSTVADVARHLKMLPRQVWELTRRRGQLRSDHPIPVVRIHVRPSAFAKAVFFSGLAILGGEECLQ